MIRSIFCVFFCQSNNSNILWIIFFPMDLSSTRNEGKITKQANINRFQVLICLFLENLRALSNHRPDSFFMKATEQQQPGEKNWKRCNQINSRLQEVFVCTRKRFPFAGAWPLFTFRVHSIVFKLVQFLKVLFTKNSGNVNKNIKNFFPPCRSCCSPANNVDESENIFRRVEIFWSAFTFVSLLRQETCMETYTIWHWTNRT